MLDAFDGSLNFLGFECRIKLDFSTKSFRPVKKKNYNKLIVNIDYFLKPLFKRLLILAFYNKICILTLTMIYNDIYH